MYLRLPFAVLAVSLILGAWPTRADSFSMAPMRLEFAAKPGATQTQTLTVRNDSDGAVSVILAVKDFRRLPNGQERELPAGTATRGCSTWLTVSPRVIELAPKERRQVRVSIRVPADANGTYAAFIFGEQTSALPVRQVQKDQFSLRVAVKPRWCIRIHLTVPDTLQLAGQVEDVTLAPATAATPMQLSVTFANTGNALLRCQGRVEIRDGRGETVKTALLDGNGAFNVYPGDKRVVAADFADKLAPGPYLALAIVDFGGEHLVAGEMQFQLGEK